MSEIKPLDQQLTVIDEEGNEVLCQILFTFDSPEFGKKYVLFYPLDDSVGDDEDVTIMAASYVESADGNGELEAVETDEEWDLIEDVLSQYEDSMDECGDDCECHHDHCECEHDEEEKECHCGCEHHHKDE